ncbi:MAG: NADPH:quinone oxidoreductase family protein, partial [Vulcanimicrobiaceae bacterium]
MKAAIVRSFGGALVVEDVPQPNLREGEVLIEVHAAAVNFSDTLVIDGKYQSLPSLPFTPGRSVAGVVAQTGERVVGFLDQGGYAEFAVARTDCVHPMPEALDFDAAVAIVHAAQTAYFALHDRLQLQAGESVLITGASGVIGSACLQIAKTIGARTVAGVRSQDAADFVRSLGADGVVDLAQDDIRDSLRAQILALTAGQGVDGIVELIGGNVFDAAVRCLAWRGRLVTLGFVSGQIPSLKMNYPLLKNITIAGMQWTNYRDRLPELVRRAQIEINDLLVSRKLHAHVAATFPLHDAAVALDAVRRGG